MKNILFAHCTGGIGDKFKILCNTMYLAEIWDKKLIIKWSKGAHCKLPFEEMFSNHYELCNTDIPDCKRLGHLDRLHTAPPGDVYIKSGSITQYKSSLIPIEQFLNQMGQLQINHQLSEKARYLKKQFNLSPNDYGFHMRRTDKGHIVTIEQQLSKLAELVVGNQKILVTSDEARAEQEAKLRFPDNVIVRQKSFPEFFNGKINRSGKSIRAGLIDLLLLITTTFVSCRPSSAFADTVKYLQLAPKCKPRKFLLTMK